MVDLHSCIPLVEMTIVVLHQTIRLSHFCGHIQNKLNGFDIAWAWASGAEARLLAHVTHAIKSRAVKIPGFDPSTSQASTVDLEKEARSLQAQWKILGVTSTGKLIPPTEVLAVHSTVKVLEELEKIKEESAKICLRPDDAEASTEKPVPPSTAQGPKRYGTFAAMTQAGFKTEVCRFQVAGAPNLTLVAFEDLGGNMALINGGADSQTWGKNP